MRSNFSDAYYALFNPADPAATQQVLTLPLLANVFPFSNLGAPSITAANGAIQAELLAALKEVASTR